MIKIFKLHFLISTLFITACASNIEAEKVTSNTITSNTNVQVIEKITNNEVQNPKPYIYKFVDPINKYGAILSNHLVVQFYYAIQNAEKIEVFATSEELENYKTYFSKYNINNVNYNTLNNPEERSYVLTTRLNKLNNVK